jgi:hypothetical protein
LLSLDETADFSDVNETNTVINKGRDNLVDVAALFLNLSGADIDESTSAYVQLINGKYKYLLGTQRDIYRFKTRNVAFSVKVVECFNDLYQNISITTFDDTKYSACKNFIDYLVANNSDVDKIGMLAEGKQIYTNEMSKLQGITFENTLRGFVSLDFKEKLDQAIKNKDINLVKNLLK